jgi:predicted flavoprotein YhiN
MESRKVSALYFAGEVMDVDGITGGYNFQHAWSSGWIAANAISKGTN